MQRPWNRLGFLALVLAAVLPFAARAQSCVPSATVDWMVSSDPFAAPIRPAECASVEQNPPDFSWPDASADAAYQVTLVYPDGRLKTLTAAQNWINWDELLAPGIYLWQVELTDSSGTKISRAREFTVSANATPFLVPDAAALRTRVAAASHPRGLPDSTSLTLMLGERQSAVAALQIAVDSQLSSALPGAPVSSVEAEVNGESQRTLNALMAYVYTRQDSYFNEALRRLLNLASWDPRGPTSYAATARASRQIAWTLALGYDWLHPRLDTGDKSLVLAAIQARGADMYNDVIGPRARIATYPRDAEGHHTLVVLAAISTLLAGDLSEADTWLQGSLPLAINATNPWSTEEGGFANGDAFGTRDVGELLVPWYILRWSAGVDLAQKAWVRNWSRFLTYFLPPGSPSGVFGDGAEQALGEPQARFAKGYTRFAPTALGRWHASQLTGEDPTRIESLLSPLAELASNAFPDETHNSVVFLSLGQAALHSNLADPARTSIYFKSSPAPYGSFDHSHADQNSFVINAGGERLAIGSGYYDGYGTPHWREWYKQTRAHNAITFDGGKGQLFLEQDGKMGYGAITNYGLNQDQDIVHGDATQAYGGALREAKRSIVYLRPNLVLVYDRLASDIPRRWEWNIHALNPMTVVSDRQISIESNGRRLCVDMLAGPAMRFTQTDRFTAEPNGNLPRQWHGNFSSVNRLSATEFIALLDVGCSAAAASASKTGGLWTVLAGNKTVTISDIGISVGPSASSALVSPTEITSPPPLPDTQAPSVPTGLVATAVSSTQVTLTWNASTDNAGVTGYYVYLNNVALATTTATSFTHTGLTAGTTYNYRVSAFDAVPNHSAWTMPVAVTTADTQAPSVPAGLVATAVSSTQITLSWNASTDNVGVTGYTVYLNNAVLARPTETSFSHAGLAPCTTYNYRVSAFDAVPNHSAWTASVAVTTPGADCQAPSVPTGLVVTAVSSTQVNLTWNASADNIGVVGYTVYLNNSVLAHTTETTFSHTGLTAGTTYNYRVSAYDAIPNHSAWTTPVAVTTPPPPDTQAPSAPANLAANGVSTSQVNLSWSAATDNVGVSGYRVYRDGALVASPAGTTATITGLSASTVYAFTVAALDAAGNASAQSAPLSVTTSSVPDITAPTVPTGLVATVNSPVNLSWTASTDDVGVAGYRVYRDGALVASPVGTTVTITGLSASTVYAFTVAALDAAGNASAQSAPLSVTTPPAPDATAPSTPAGLTASALTATSLTLSWSAAVDNVVVSGYRVYRDGALVASPAGTTATITGLSASTVYALTVAALDAAGNASAQSAPLSVTTPALFSTLDPYLGDLANWEPLTASRWSVVSDGSDLRYGINTTGYSNLPTERLGEYSLVKDRTYGDFAFSARARSTEDLTANPFADYAVVFGLQDANNYYYAIFNRNAASTQLFKVVGGVAQPALATANFAIPDNNYHRVDVVRTGSLITASFDGVPILQASDATFGAGRIGIGGKNDAAWWDDIAIALAAVADTQAPTVPANLSVTQLSASQITLAWSAATDNVAVIGYRVYRDGTLVASPAGTSVAITGLSAGTLYAFSVAALDAAGNASAPSAPLSVTTPAPDLIAPSVPTGLVGTAVSPTQINLTWNAATDNVGVTGYRVYLNDAVLATTTATSFTHTGLAAGTTYNYRVSAHDAVPNHSAWTATPVSVTTPVAPGTPPSAIDSADILSAAHADIPFSQQRGYSVQVLGTFPNVTSIPESGIHGSTLPNGETLRFGKVADPVNSTGKALAFQVSPGDPVTAGSKRAEIKFGNNVEMNKVYWYAVSVYIYDWGSLASGDNGLFAAQLHSGDDSRGLSPSFGLYTAGSNGRSFSVEARWSTSTSPSQGNTVIARYATRPIPFGRWMDFVFKFRQSTSGNGFMQVWLDGAQIVDHQGLLGFNTPGYRDYVKSGYYNWSSAFNSARKVLVRSPVVVLDPTGDKYNADDLRAFLAQ
jgi:chitodextrinase